MDVPRSGGPSRPRRAPTVEVFFVASMWEDVKSVLPSIRSTSSTPIDDTASNITKTATDTASSTVSSIKSILPSIDSARSSSSSTSSTSSWSFFKKADETSIKKYIPENPAVVSGLTAVAAVGGTVGVLWMYRRYGKRIRNSDYVTSGMLDRKIWIRGKVTSVGDGDNFRLFHTPLFYSWPLKLRSIPDTPKALKDETLHIRISGVDAPEAAHFGNPAQPHSAESLEWLRKTIMGKTMRCQLLRKDQYNRIVAVPYIRRLILRDKPLPLMMLEKGMAVVYTSGGGEYGDWGLGKMQAIEAQAKRAKKGLWALKKFESPADYKKRVKAGGDEAMIGSKETAKESRSGIMRWIKSMFA